jgi:hypothetical protein
MEIARKMVGKYWSHSPETLKALSDKAKARWAKMSKKKRAAVGKTISKAKKGIASTQTDAQREARAEKIRAHWASMSADEKAARVRKATRARRAGQKAKPKK